MISTDVLQQVAEAKCPHCHGWTLERVTEFAARGMNVCTDCHGTCLRWSSLSRECDNDLWVWDAFPQHLHEGRPCVGCLGSGRVPDVTLEKVLEILTSDHDLDIIKRKDYWAVQSYVNVEWHKGNIPLEAACAALLAT